jgi:hypothetical protein
LLTLPDELLGDVHIGGLTREIEHVSAAAGDEGHPVAQHATQVGGVSL